MNLRTTLALLLVVLALAGLAYWQSSRETAATAELDYPLFEGVDPARIRAVRIEQTHFDAHVRLERGADGHWRMTDPESVRANDAMIEHLLSSALTRRATPVPPGEADPAKLGFEPPTAIVDVEEDVGGTTRRSRLELGALDADGKRVNVRVNGRLLRTWRDLDTTLARRAEDWRSPRVIDLDPREIVEIHRTGEVLGVDGRMNDVRLDALAENGAWRATGPVAGQLDPLSMALVTNGVAGLEVKGYADEGSRVLADWGLDPPEARLTLVTASGKTVALRMGRRERRPPGEWMATIEGEPQVFAIDPGSVDVALMSLENLLDHRLWRATQESIELLEIATPARTLEIARDRRGWTVRQKRAGEEEFGPRLAAERAKVEDLLARLDRVELLGFDRALTLPDADVAGTLHVHALGERQGGSISKPVEHDGAQVVLFRRDGDDAIARADRSVGRALDVAFEDLLSLLVHELVEIEQRTLAITDGRTTREFTRGGRGLWTPKGSVEEARELREVLDPLLFLRAERHLGAGERAELLDSITVTFLDVNDVAHVAVIGRAAPGTSGSSPGLDGKTLLQVEGRLSIARDQDLLARLAKVLAS